ncbi:hypothetical protein [Colwellia sp. 12G3]|uniref:hypothetical protein n=1 Tax=Colwellia sp. 12G3 TaxID=2058299 RepID=UPI000C330523|nr:hypothetical protein [Colwellia sp. 12G3]PKI15274.1 hypothetical protein CXF71_13070 [Colwellia sp. 12G3]
MLNHEKCLDKIKSNAANLIVVAALYIGYAFFEVSLIYDSVILFILGVVILKWKSRVASIAALIFGVVSLYLLISSSNSDGIRFLAAGVIVWSGALSTYFTVKFQKPKVGGSGI